MLRRIRAALAVTLAIGLGAGAAEAASIIKAELLNPPAGGSYNIGDEIDVKLTFDFPTDGKKSFGGGIELAFDERLVQVVGFQLATRWPVDPKPDEGFNRPLGSFPGKGRLLAFGDFNPFNGKDEIGRLKLKAIAAGDGSVLPGPNDAPAGPFVDEGGDVMTVAFQGANFKVANVPEPGTLMLLGAGLVGLAASRRARS